MACQSKIMAHGALPIFATIPKFHLETYNNTMLKHCKTSIHLHRDFYPEMQERLNITIDKINEFICQINRRQRVSIPFLHTTIMKRRGRKKTSYYIYHWHLLDDGLHPSDQLKEQWANSISAAIRKNRTKDDSDSDPHSPKRSWLREKRPKRQ